MTNEEVVLMGSLIYKLKLLAAEIYNQKFRSLSNIDCYSEGVKAKDLAYTLIELFYYDMVGLEILKALELEKFMARSDNDGVLEKRRVEVNSVFLEIQKGA